MASAIALKPCILTPVPRATSARAFDASVLIFSREHRSRRTVVTYNTSALETTIETCIFRTFASVNRREPVRIWCEYANTRRLRPLRQSHTTSDEISACEYGANV